MATEKNEHEVSETDQVIHRVKSIRATLQWCIKQELEGAFTVLEVQALLRRIDTLEAENARLMADKERLDSFAKYWTQAGEPIVEDGLDGHFCPNFPGRYRGNLSFREAVDLAVQMIQEDPDACGIYEQDEHDDPDWYWWMDDE